MMNTVVSNARKLTNLAFWRALQATIVMIVLLTVSFMALLFIPQTQSFAGPSPVNEVIRLINQERKKAGMPPLEEDCDMREAAGLRAHEAARRFSHTRPNGNKWSTVFTEYNINAVHRGENLAYGQKTAKAVVKAWMKSERHRQNILNESFDRVAVGQYVYNGVHYWSQLFIDSVFR